MSPRQKYIISGGLLFVGLVLEVLGIKKIEQSFGTDNTGVYYVAAGFVVGAAALIIHTYFKAKSQFPSSSNKIEVEILAKAGAQKPPREQ